jgi:hypothetical protein
MANDIRIQPVPPLPSGSAAAAETKAMTYLSPAPADSFAAPAIANPSLRLDPALGLVVLEFHGGAGAVTTSIPSERQLQAYQRWVQTGIGTPPGGMASSGATGNRQGTQAGTQTGTQIAATPSAEPSPQAPPPPGGNELAGSQES